MPRLDLPPEYLYDIMLDDIAEGGRADRLPSDASRTAWPEATSDRPAEAFFLGRAAAEGLIAMTVLSVPCGQARDGRLMPAANVLGRAKDWRIRLDLDWRMPMDTVLSGASIAAGRPLPGEFAAWDSAPVTLDRACRIFTAAIGGIDFGGDRSVMSVVTTNRMQIKYSRSLWWYTLRGILQRCRSKCFYGKKEGIFCLQRGYPDDVEMFSASLDKLNVGSSDGGWPKRPFGLTSVKSLPLRMFYREAVEIDPPDSLLLQAADLLAHAVLLRIQGELGWLPGCLRGTGVETAYDRLPSNVLNTAASRTRADAIVQNG